MRVRSKGRDSDQEQREESLQRFRSNILGLGGGLQCGFWCLVPGAERRVWVKRTERWSLAQRLMRKAMSAPKTVLLRSSLSTRFIAILPTCLPIPQTLLVALSNDPSRALTR